MGTMWKIVGVLVACTLAKLATADLPVHCPHHTLVGSWDFHMSKGSEHKSLKCNKKLKHTGMGRWGFHFNNKVLGKPNFKKDMKWKVSLANPNIALVTDEKGRKHRGKWTSIYDEGQGSTKENAGCGVEKEGSSKNKEG